ncbi:uncharacterized protein SPSK_10178 [Sporothrix schenckii 1099-18]|uniref:Uncharacterized protein n=1 Tax=Sporothrix schenckii 1099-18 TaxID=1397361 RepID=A0A0F2M5C0_SPOSC|nr:uncharacterized protein SPSK_10178 [Sporothrix schenckii 1099-18]KJR84822.1 hypothetical protein SPSK_10178 [Sporothrix schenckii 1099-18]
MRDMELMSSSSPLPAGAMKATSALDAALNFQDMSDVINGNCKPYSIVSVVGVVTGVLMPRQTRKGMKVRVFHVAVRRAARA